MNFSDLAGTSARRLAAIVAMLALMIAAGAPARAQTSITSVGIPELSEAADLFAEAVAESDMARIGSFYGEGAVLFTPDGSILRGREQIVGFYSNNASIGPNVMNFEQFNFESEGKRGSIVWQWELTIRPRGETPETLRGRSLLYLADTPFGWKILFEMFQLAPESAERP